MIELWPAIDLIDGKSVRLTEGDYDTSQPMPRTPEQAIRFYQSFPQVKRIHLVDLMVALKAGPTEMETLAELIRLSELPVEIGGGIRSRETIEAYFKLGADFLIIGTKGLKDPKWLKEMAEAYPGKLYLGLDAKGTEVAVNGWTESIGATIFEVAEEAGRMPLGGIIYTDIRKDGRMAGPSFELTGELAGRCALPVIASGGVRSRLDIEKLEQLGVHAAIVGKAANTDRFWEEFK